MVSRHCVTVLQPGQQERNFVSKRKKMWAKDMNRQSSKEDTQKWLTNVKKMLNITNYQENANLNHNEIPPYSCKNGHHFLNKKKK